MRRQSGFTLLEVMLAFALLAVGLGLLLAIQSSGLRQVRQAALVSEASLHAQSLLDEIGVLEPLQPGQREGEFADGRFRWHLAVAEAEDPARDAAPPWAGQLPLPPEAWPNAPRLYRIALEVRRDGSETPLLRLQTLRARQPLEPR